jgi:hypothetical protein
MLKFPHTEYAFKVKFVPEIQRLQKLPAAF